MLKLTIQTNTKHRAASLRQLSYLCLQRVALRYRWLTSIICHFRYRNGHESDHGSNAAACALLYSEHDTT